MLSRNTALVKWLVDTQLIDINAKNQFGETALHYATRENNREVVELLVSKRADLTIQNENGHRAADIALKHGLDTLLPFLTNPIVNLFQKIRAMYEYGLELKAQYEKKGHIVIKLATDLNVMANQFFKQEPELRNFPKFELKFSELLHSKDQELSSHWITWESLFANITIALTDLGRLLTRHSIHSRVTEGRALFFYHTNKTTGEEKRADIEQSVTLIAQEDPSASDLRVDNILYSMTRMTCA